ncbi:hypothetical protein [Desulfoluna spongiiphila]|uniref:hypothetical protein n=1 Tax=Desulfoluna spongiiphila TaxID=419481 RepID=UPI001587F35E|nr:hypothetical protein [Desulfoluna spongiiphila]
MTKPVFTAPRYGLVAPGTVTRDKQPSAAYPVVSTMDAMTETHTSCERRRME